MDRKPSRIMIHVLSLALTSVFLTCLCTLTSYAKDSETVIPVYRLYNETNMEHLYTMNPTEREMCISVGWKDEGIGWYAPQTSDWPVRRLYHAPTGSHVYSQNPIEMEMLVNAGWKLEGVAFYSSQKQEIEVRRQYYEPLKLHNYSYNEAEIQMLGTAGWKIEGTAWFASVPPKSISADPSPKPPVPINPEPETPTPVETESETPAPVETEPEIPAPSEPTPSPSYEQPTPSSNVPGMIVSPSDIDKDNAKYFVNLRTKKYHYPNCKYAKQISYDNLGVFNGEESTLSNYGYSPCRHCEP